MITLILETSTEKGCLILAENDTPLLAKPLAGGPLLSKTLALECKAALHWLGAPKDASSLGLCIAALHWLGAPTPDLVAVGTGPGSYTGIRVGAALAQALAYGWRIPLMGFCSLKAFLPSAHQSAVVLVDAKSGGFYALFDGKPSLISPADPRLQTASHIASPHPDQIQKRLTTHALWHETAPHPEWLPQLVYRQFLEEGAAPLELTYLSCP